MTTFKDGDWVRTPVDSIIQVKFNEDSIHSSTDRILTPEYLSRCKLWFPKIGEWCWFWNDKQLIPLLRQYNKGNENGNGWYWVKNNNLVSDFYGYKYCEPFVNDLPTMLRDKLWN